MWPGKGLQVPPEGRDVEPRPPDAGAGDGRTPGDDGEHQGRDQGPSPHSPERRQPQGSLGNAAAPQAVELWVGSVLFEGPRAVHVGPLPDHMENPGLSLMPGPEFSVFGALGTPHTPILALLTAKGRPVEKLSEREREMRLNEAGVF